MPDGPRQPPLATWIARLVAAAALLAVLCLPALHAAHLALADGDAQHAHVEHDEHAHHDHGPTSHGHQKSHDHPASHHDAAHCAICLSFGSLHDGSALFDLTVASAFDAPATFPTPLYVAPHARAFVPTVAVPRGPPALPAC